MSDRDEINEFLRQEIRLGEMREKVKEELTEATPLSPTSVKKVDVILQRDQTIHQLQSMLEEAVNTKDTAQTELE